MPRLQHLFLYPVRFDEAFATKHNVEVFVGINEYALGLLGHILAEVAGTDYETLVKKRITEPFEMNDTAITLSVDLRSRLAVGHNSELKPPADPERFRQSGAGHRKRRPQVADITRAFFR